MTALKLNIGTAVLLAMIFVWSPRESSGQFQDSQSQTQSQSQYTPQPGVQGRESLEAIPFGRPNERSQAAIDTSNWRNRLQVSTASTLASERTGTSSVRTAPDSLLTDRAPDYRNDRYPYPGGEVRTAQLTRQQQLVARPQNAAPEAGVLRQTAFQAPALNFGQAGSDTRAAAPTITSNLPAQGTTGFFQAPANQPPALATQPRATIQPPVNLQGSTGAYQYQIPVQINPGTATGGQITVQPTQAQIAQLCQNQCCNNNGTVNGFFSGVNTQVGTAGGAFQNWLNPLMRGTGAYQPIIRLQNMPPGTYLGQGIIGQPKAYVDGQPVRNLLRYIVP